MRASMSASWASDKEREAMLAALGQKRTGYIRSLLAQRLKIRKVPELRFSLDNSLGIWREDRKDPWRIRRLIRAKSI